MLRVERRDGSGERAVLTGAVTDRHVLGAVAERWDGELFSSRWSNLVAGWAVEHYRKYRKAPGAAIRGYLDRWAESGQDEETVRLIEGYLAGLSEELERKVRRPTPEYVLDLAARHFNLVRLARVREELEGDLEVRDVDRGLDRMNKFRPVEIGTGAGVSLLKAEAEVRRAFNEKEEVVIRYPGALGNFFDRSLARDSFIAFMGKEKVGKSYFLQDMAVRSVIQGNNTAYFELGDQSENQLYRRFGVRIARRPLWGDPAHHVRIPRAIMTGDPPEVTYEEKIFPDDLTDDACWDALRKLGARVGDDKLRVSCHPNSSLSVRGVETILEGWERDGWAPDAVFLDYADIMAPTDGRAETRDQINATWKGLRALSQRWHCLVATLTQTDADSYHRPLLKRDNFSEDKRKYAHVTGTVGINQNADEKTAGLYRLNWVVLRELEFSEEKCVWCAACLALGNPAVRSIF
jgi:hypothetical protein